MNRYQVEMMNGPAPSNERKMDHVVVDEDARHPYYRHICRANAENATLIAKALNLCAATELKPLVPETGKQTLAA